MLAAQFTTGTELPHPGSEGFLRGTGAKVRVLQRNHRPSPGGERTCLVKLFQLVRGQWHPVEDARGNRTVEERDIYETAELATFCGKPPKPRRERRGRRAR